MTDHYPVTITLPRPSAEALIAALTAATARTNDQRIDAILANTERLLTMSGSISAQIDDAAARDEAAMAKLSADLGKIADELKATAPAPGTTVTQAQADRHTAIATALEAAAAAADALVTAPTSPASVVFNAADPTPNGSTMADGTTIRNTPGADPANPMAGFDPTKPATT